MEREMATHSNVLACRIPGTAEPGRLPSMGLHRIGHDWSNLMDMGLGELQVLVMDRKAWRAAIHGVAKSRTRLSDWTELNWLNVYDRRWLAYKKSIFKIINISSNFKSKAFSSGSWHLCEFLNLPIYTLKFSFLYSCHAMLSCFSCVDSLWSCRW